MVTGRGNAAKSDATQRSHGLWSVLQEAATTWAEPSPHLTPAKGCYIPSAARLLALLMYAGGYTTKKKGQITLAFAKKLTMAGHS